jgi:hypothetical protein
MSKSAAHKHQSKSEILEALEFGAKLEVRGGHDPLKNRWIREWLATAKRHGYGVEALALVTKHSK